MNVNVLFTSVGRRVELLQTLRRAYERSAIPGRIVAVDAEPLAAGLRMADVAYVVPPLESEEYVPALKKILAEEQVTAVFPLIDPDIPVLAGNRDVLEATGARLAVIDAKMAWIMADKWLTYHFLAGLGLRVPASWVPSEPEKPPEGCPLFVKPRFGSASQKVFRVDTADELAFFVRYVKNPIVQEFLAGPEITSDVICDLDGGVLAVVSRQRIRVRAGEVAIGKTVFDPAITEACLRIAAALPAIGPITVQCMMHEGEPVFTEVNARLGGGAPCGVAAGSDWPQLLLARLAGQPIEVPALGSYQVGLYFSRFDESVLISEAELEGNRGQPSLVRSISTRPA